MGYERELSARQKALDLSKKKDAIETEMDALAKSLSENGGPGMSGNLVDAEGFPRSDIDVHAVRVQRHRFATLRTDHRLVSAEMEALMHIALAPRSPGAAPASSSSSSPPTHAPPAPRVAANGAPPRHTAFAMVDVVTPASPAAAADLRVGDRLVAFGGVSLRAFATPGLALGALPGLLREHENVPVEIVVDRGAPAPARQTLVTMQLTPQRWPGQGLLGCHVVPLQVAQEDEHYQPEVATATMRHSSTGFHPV